MPLVDLTADLSKIKKLFGSKTKTAGKTGSFPHRSLENTPNTGPNATSIERQSLEDRFNAGVPGPNRNFGNLVNQATPTVPTTMEGTPAKTTPLIQSNWTVFTTIADRSPRYPKLEENKGEYQYFKQYQSALDPNARGTYGSAWKHGKVVLPADSSPPYDASTIKNDQYTKYSKTYLFPKGLLGDFTSFPDIPSKRGAYPPSILTIPRGGPVLTIKRGLKDIERHAKWFLSTKGIIWGLTQAGLQLLNPRPETRIWNPLSLGSIIPTIHIPRHIQKIPLGINLQLFGAERTSLTRGKSGLGGSTYTEAKDYITVPDTAILEKTIPGSGSQSRLEAHLTQWIEKDIENDEIGQNFINLKRRTPGQLIYLIPGGGGIFGNLNFRNVYSQRHLSAAGIPGDPIHKHTDQVVHKTVPSLGRYKTLSYGRLEALAESDVRRGTPHQFKWEGSIDEAKTFVPIGKRKDSEYSKYGFKEGKDGQVEITELEAKKDLRLEKRYKLGDPGKPGIERLRATHGTNASSGDKLDTVDLLNVLGYIPPQGAADGVALADGTSLHIDNFGPTNGDYPDLVPLHFYDTVNKAWILFRAYIGKFNDSVKPNWGNTQYAGRPTPQYYYQNTERSISFDFQVAAQSAVELAPLWQKLNYLVGLCYPSFTGGAFPTMRNPFIKLTLGDVYHHVPGFLTQLTMTPIDNIPWEVIRDPDKGLARVPMGMNISTDFTYVGDSMPSSKSPYHFLNNEQWIDHSNSYWTTKNKKGIRSAYPKRLDE